MNIKVMPSTYYHFEFSLLPQKKSDVSLLWKGNVHLETKRTKAARQCWMDPCSKHIHVCLRTLGKHWPCPGGGLLQLFCQYGSQVLIKSSFFKIHQILILRVLDGLWAQRYNTIIEALWKGAQMTQHSIKKQLSSDVYMVLWVYIIIIILTTRLWPIVISLIWYHLCEELAFSHSNSIIT